MGQFQEHHKGTDFYERRIVSETYRKSRAQKGALIAEVVDGLLRQSPVVLDIGSGTGLIKRWLGDRYGRRIFGIEPDFRWSEVREDLIAADASALPVRTNSVDLILCNNVYEHVRAQEELLREMYRALRPSGKVYFTVGSRFQVMEPHFRLPFLSWLPPRAAERYLQLTGRGDTYQDIRFPIYSRLMSQLRTVGFSVKNVTSDLLFSGRTALSRRYRWARIAGVLPRCLVDLLLNLFSPQWILLLTKNVKRQT